MTSGNFFAAFLLFILASYGACDASLLRPTQKTTMTDAEKSGTDNALAAGPKDPDSPLRRAQAAPSGSESFIKLVLKLDDHPEDTSWELRESGVRVVQHWVEKETYVGMAFHTVTKVLPVGPETGYDFVMFDSHGDGFKGSYQIFGATGALIASSDGFMGTAETLTFNTGSANTIDVPPFRPYVNVRVILDEYPEEISWEIVKSDTKERVHWVEAGHYLKEMKFKKEITGPYWLEPNTKYQFIIKDTFGDGLQGGTVELFDNNDNTVALIHNFGGFELAIDFQVRV